MNSLLLYLVKITAGTTLFYLCYLLFFRNDTFYLRNRIILILTLLLPTVVPALKITVNSVSALPAEPVTAIENIIYPVTAFEATFSATTNSFDYSKILLLIYFVVAGLLLLRGVISLMSTFKIIKNGEITSSTFPKIIVTDYRISPFSFFPYAVIPVEDYMTENSSSIIEHEFAHIRQGHTFDLLLSEFFIVIQWFNPFIWLVKRSIIQNHEYLADHVSLKNNKNIKEYQYRLLNVNTRLRNISLAHNFNSLIKNRILMINRKPSRKYAAIKSILILPVLMFVVYAFASQDYRYSNASSADISPEVNKPAEIIQKDVKGIVVKEDGTPLEGVYVASTGTLGRVVSASTGSDGRFALSNVQDGSFLVLNLRGYASVTVKADLNSEMVIKMSKNGSYSESRYVNEPDKGSPDKPLTVLDGVISDQPTSVLISRLGNEFATVEVLKGKEATDKYGDAGKNGVEEVYSRKKAIELGLKFPFRRINPDEYPTFQGASFTTFNEWLVKHTKYPPEAVSKGIQGRVTVIYTIKEDGSVTDVHIQGMADPVLADAVIETVKSSPRWEPAVSEIARVPFASMAGLKFELPDKVSPDDAYMMAEKMPMYPGGDAEMLRVISDNIKYPESAKNAGIEGRVIIRFLVNTKGDAEEVSVLRGVHPLLDEEGVRVVSMLKGFTPGMQGGKAVNVWYMVPINFTLPKADAEADKLAVKSEPFVVVENMPEFPGGSDAMLNWISKNVKYPDAALRGKAEGIVVVRFVVTSEGKVSEPVVLRSENQLFNEEAVRVTGSMPIWKPGSQNGKNVDVYAVAPVEFKLK